MNTTKTEAIENFREIAQQVVSSAPSAKGRAFAERVIASISAKGEDWISSHADALRATFVPGSNFPVAENRLYYLAAFQAALASK